VRITVFGRGYKRVRGGLKALGHARNVMKNVCSGKWMVSTAFSNELSVAFTARLAVLIEPLGCQADSTGV
jgi:hypothetical protein